MTPSLALNLEPSYSYPYLSKNVADLAEIYRPDINICVIERGVSHDIETFVTHLLSKSRAVNVTETLYIQSFNPHTLLPQHLHFQGYEAFCADIAQLVDMFSHLFELENVGLRLGILDKAMCPRFHVDHVPCRLVTAIKLRIFPFALSLSKGERKNPKPGVKPFMLRQAQHERLNLMVVCRLVCTYGGIGTQWLEDAYVDRSKLGSRSGGLSDEVSGLILDADAIGTMPNYAIGLLKGSRWEGNELNGAVHRSPSLNITAPRRLLLTLDFG